MNLTAKQIYDKTFKRSFKGYDENEVDEFLDLIIKDFVELSDENAKLKEQIAALEAERARFEEERGGFEAQLEQVRSEYATKAQTAKDEVQDMEARVSQTLLTAQRTADIMLTESKAEADKMVRDARERATKLDGAYYVQLAKQKKNLTTMRGLVEQCKSDFEFLLDKNRRLFTEKSADIIATIDEFDLSQFDLDPIVMTDEDVVPPQPAPEPPSKAELFEEVAVEKPAEEQKFTSNYADYSWLYDENEAETVVNLPRTSAEDEENLKKLIDEIIE